MVGRQCARNTRNALQGRAGGLLGLQQLTLTVNRYQVVVLSNQGGLNLKPDPKRAKADQKRISEFKGKVNAVVVGLDIPIRVYAATAKDRFRKPRVGMWEQIVRDAGMQLQDIDLDQSFFVGDAGGRPASAGTRSDHSCCDRCGPNDKEARQDGIDWWQRHGSERGNPVPYAGGVFPKTGGNTVCACF